jgi:hypothetical protein
MQRRTWQRKANNTVLKNRLDSEGRITNRGIQMRQSGVINQINPAARGLIDNDLASLEKSINQIEIEIPNISHTLSQHFLILDDHEQRIRNQEQTKPFVADTYAQRVNIPPDTLVNESQPLISRVLLLEKQLSTIDDTMVAQANTSQDHENRISNIEKIRTGTLPRPRTSSGYLGISLQVNNISSMSERIRILDNAINNANVIIMENASGYNDREIRISSLESKGNTYLRSYADNHYRTADTMRPSEISRGEEYQGIRPPIVPNDYHLSYLQTLINGIPANYWYLIPDMSKNGEIYRFSWKNAPNKYIYEPVDPKDYSIVFPPSSTDGTHVTYVYENIPDYGWGLRPYLYGDKVSVPHTIFGYVYTQINLSNPLSRGWCYAPVSYFRNIIFKYPRLSNGQRYHTVDKNLIDQYDHVTKFPVSAISSDPNMVIKSDIIPFGTGVAFMLPYDNFSYKVVFTAELRISTDDESMSLLSGSDIVGAQPAVAQLVVCQMTESGAIDIRKSDQAIHLTRADLIKEAPPHETMNRVFLQNDIEGEPGKHYKTGNDVSSGECIIDPIIDEGHHPFGRRIITVVVTRGFSFSHVKINIVKM